MTSCESPRKVPASQARGTGLDMAIGSNKVPGVLAAPDEARAIVAAWLAAEFRGGGPARQVAKIRAIEERCRVAVAPTGTLRTRRIRSKSRRLGG